MDASADTHTELYALLQHCQCSHYKFHTIHAEWNIPRKGDYALRGAIYRILPTHTTIYPKIPNRTLFACIECLRLGKHAIKVCEKQNASMYIYI